MAIGHLIARLLTREVTGEFFSLLLSHFILASTIAVKSTTRSMPLISPLPMITI